MINNPHDADHSRLRKILGVAFSDKAVREREPFLQDYTTLLIKRLKEQPVGKSIDMVWWFDCIGFDTVAHLTFGDSFHALCVLFQQRRSVADLKVKLLRFQNWHLKIMS
jgi:cytochrome P450